MIGEENPNLRLGKASQISAPSDPQIISLIDEMTWRVAQRRRFNGQPVTKQLFLNCVLTKIAEDGPEMWNYLFDGGAAILSPALMAGEPGIPAIASRPLRKRFKHFSDTSPPTVAESENKPMPRPLPSVRLSGVKNNDGGRTKGDH